MIKAIRNDPESQRLDLGDRLLPALPVDHHAPEVRHLGNPATVFFAINFDFHSVILSEDASFHGLTSSIERAPSGRGKVASGTVHG